MSNVQGKEGRSRRNGDHTWWLRKDLLHLIIHSTNIFKGPARRFGASAKGLRLQVEQRYPCWHSCTVPPQSDSGHRAVEYTPQPLRIRLCFLSLVSKLIQSRRQLLKCRYFILMWVIPIISYIKMSDFSCHPTGGRVPLQICFIAACAYVSILFMAMRGCHQIGLTFSVGSRSSEILTLM